MSNRISLTKIRSVAATEYIKWICDPRMIIFFGFFIFVYDYIILEMKSAAADMGMKCMILEPFLAIGNSPLLILLIPVVFITLLGDFPKTDGNTMFYICRTGKKNWVLGQMLFAFFAELTYMLAMVIFSVLAAVSFSEWSNQWSDVTTKYVYTFPDKIGSLVANLLTNQLYNNIPPVKAFFETFTLVTLYLFFISAIMMTGFAFGRRMAGIILNCAIMCIGSAFSLTEGGMKWFFPAANTIGWLHYDPYMKKQIFEMKYSYLYFAIWILLLIIVDIKAINRYDFAKITDMED